MNLLRILLTLTIFIGFLGCTASQSTEPIPLHSIEDSGIYNEGYRDSVLVISWLGVSIIHKTGTGLRLLTPEKSVSATWCPLKSKILYCVGGTLKIMDADGTHQRTLAQFSDPLQYAIASRDGFRIAYISVDTTDPTYGTGSIGLLASDGTNSGVLATFQPVPNRLSWTPDGTHLVFNGKNTSGNVIYSLSVSTKQTAVLYHAYQAFCFFPSVSPDGNYIAFSGTVDTADKIKILTLATGVVTQATFGSSSDGEPSWSEDGKKIAYSRGEPNGPYSWIGSSIWTLELATGSVQRITPYGLYDYWYPCWQQ